MIKVENISFQYKNSTNLVLKDLNFTVNTGEIVAIVGKNGTGKSTIGRLIAGISKIKQGKIWIDDMDISQKKNRKQIQDKVGIVFQNPENQIIFNHIEDELAFALKDLSPEEKQERIQHALKQVDMLEVKNEDLYTLSLGQKQRIMIAEVLARNPQYIIFDEPTTMIDSQGKEKIYQIIRNLKQQGYTIICITNLADEILLADRTLILEDGKIMQEIAKKDLIEKASLLTKYDIKIPTVLTLLTRLKEEGIALSVETFEIDEIVEKLKGKVIHEKCI